MPVNLRFPSINGPSEKEQLQQMRTYLYQLVGDLQFVLDDITLQLTSLKEDSNSDTFKNYISKSECVDYDIEQDNVSGWTYKKQKNGTYEMYGTFEVSPTTTTFNSVLYHTEVLSVSPPFAVTSAYVSGTAAGTCWIIDAGISNEGDITFRIMSDSAIDIATPIKVHLYVIGNYTKQRR